MTRQYKHRLQAQDGCYILRQTGNRTDYKIMLQPASDHVKTTNKQPAMHLEYRASKP